MSHSYLLNEDGSYLLLEDGDKILLEESVEEDTGVQWAAESKLPYHVLIPFLAILQFFR